MDRAKYLCAYGSTPRGEINWYKYRLDRIISKHLESLDWQDSRIPQLLKEKYQENNLPTPKTVNDMLKEAWGCDFYKETALMVLRFDRTFAQSYLQGISIHSTCTAIDIDRAATLIKQYTPKPEHRSALLQILQSRPTDDAYYQVTYRVTDYYPRSVVASFRFRSRNSATLGLTTENGRRNPKNCQLVPIVFRSIIIKSIVENLPISVENPPFPVEN